MRKINIYLVETPMQLLSAIEAKEYFKEDDSLLIIKNVYREINNEVYNKAMYELELFSKWDKIVKIPYRLSTYAVLYHLFKIKKMKQKINGIFVGSPRVRVFQWFCENLEMSQCFHLDEGTTAIVYQNSFFFKKDYLQDNDFSYIQKGTLSLTKIRNSTLQKIKNTFKVIIKRHVFGLNSNRRIKYNLFTCFDLEVNPEQEYFYNKYSYTKRKISNLLKQQNIVYFYGSPLSELNIIKFEVEMDMLKKINNFYQQSEKILFYIPHPSDSQEKRSHIKKIIGIQIKKPSIMAEIEPIVNKTLPSDIASFYSTALFVLGKIYDYDSITSFKIPDCLICENRKSDIKKIYEEYEKIMEVVLLHEN